MVSVLASVAQRVYNPIHQINHYSIALNSIVLSTVSQCVTLESNLQRIQVECLTASVIAFAVTVELIAWRGKMADVARRH